MWRNTNNESNQLRHYILYRDSRIIEGEIGNCQ